MVLRCVSQERGAGSAKTIKRKRPPVRPRVSFGRQFVKARRAGEQCSAAPESRLARLVPPAAAACIGAAIAETRR
ncbi:hypothetical protein MRX96_050840 [Rhipicephalus microplus]